jgi:hypothetical protein
MKRAQLIKGTVCMLLGALLAAPIAFWFGARVGVEEFQYADAKSRAAIVTFQLEKIQRQDIAALESGMQIELNLHLADYGRYLQSNWKWLWPEADSSGDRAIRHAAMFRVAHPFEGPDLSLASAWKPGMSMSDPFIAGVVDVQRKNKQLVTMVLAKYGK